MYDNPMQEAIYVLEEYKRRLGRNFDQTKEHHRRVMYFNKYNHTENLIQELCATHQLKRRSLPHKLKFENV